MRGNAIKIPVSIDRILGKVEKLAKPLSIFIYGSRARNDFEEKSDYEIGVLFRRNKKWGRKELKELHEISGLNLYPFVYEDLIKYSPDTPFPIAIYMRELVEGAKTLRGKKVVEKMKVPTLRVSDLLEEASFQVAYAMAAVLSSRQSDWVTASIEFTKSVLFGVRVLVILDKGMFPLSYSDIAGEGMKLELGDEYKNLIEDTIGVREGKKPEADSLYTNISFQNQIVLRRVKRELRGGDRVVLD